MVDLYSKFENLTEDKKKKIITACIQEFSTNGYENASTNSIVLNAGISKGILFHYFGSKKRLYLYILDYVIDFMAGLVFKGLEELPADFFERIMKIGIIKMKAAYEYPVEYGFLLKAFMNQPDELKGELQKRYEKAYSDSMPKMFEGIDTSKFREGIDKDRAMELIMIALEGVNNKYMKTFKDKQVDAIMSDMEGIMSDYEKYIEILKFGIYGSEGA